MRKLFLIVTLFTLTFLGQAQEKTYVYGKLQSFCADSVELRTWEYFPVYTDYFDDKSENGITISANVQSDSMFGFSTDLVTAKFTIGILSIKGIASETLLLSPGDSLYLTVSGPKEDPVFNISGRGAGKNSLIPSEDESLELTDGFADLPADIDEDLLKNRISVYRISRQRFLSTLLIDEQIDSALYGTMKRIDNYMVLDEVFKNIEVNRSLSDGFIRCIYDSIARIDLNDLDAMSGMHYPNLIRVYPEVLAKLEKKEFPIDLLSQISIGQELFIGPIRTFFLYNLISETVSKAETLKQKYLITGYIREHIDDSRALDIVRHRFFGQKPKNDKKQSGWLAIFVAFVVGILLIWFLIRFAIRTAKTAEPIDKKSDPILAIGIILVIAIQFPLVNLMFRHPIREIWPQISGALTIFLIIVYGRFVIDFFLNGQYKKYVMWVLLCSVFYLGGLYLTLHHFGGWSTRETNGLVLKWWVIATTVVCLHSIISQYLIKLSEQNKDLRYLIQHIVDNLEFVIHCIIVSGIFFLLASKLDHYQGIRDMVWYMTLLILFYLFAFWLTPQYRFRQKMWAFRFLNVGVFIIAYLILYLNSGFFNQAALKSIGVRIPLIEFLDYREFVFYFIGISILMGTIYAYLRKNYFSKIDINLNLYRKKEAELQQLRAQVNPHFLFNSLNTIYAQALKENNDKTADSIAKLSNMMRYLIEDMDQDEIPIGKEIGYIEDYIKLQSVRSSAEHEIEVSYDLTEKQLEQKIAPMLMIPFVENAFKHGVNPGKASILRIDISMKDQRFSFTIWNSIDPEFASFEKEKGFGIGIPNVRKRLEYQYPNRHRLSIEDTMEYYQVKMSIELT